MRTSLLVLFLFSFPAFAGLAWESGHPERAPWSAEVQRLFKADLKTFDKASDVRNFCAKWNSLTDDNKILVLSTMAVAIARFESSYNPADVYREPPPLGTNSVGLFQLSYEDHMSWCSMNKAKNNLKNPIVNIQCAIPEMTKLVARDGVITGGGPRGWKGLARYWSVTRATGKLPQIKYATQHLAVCE